MIETEKSSGQVPTAGGRPAGRKRGAAAPVAGPASPLDDLDRAIVKATEAGLPLTERPYAAVAETTGLTEEEVLRRMSRMLSLGLIRCIGAVPNHYALGVTVNGMTVWDVEDTEAEKLGGWVGAFDFVSHCYLRPRHLPVWPYNLLAMVHGRSRDEVRDKALRIATLLGKACRSSDILFSTRILKKAGMRLAG